MKDKKYIFFDIDGTLIDQFVNISDSTKKAISLAKDKGHEIFLCTGRAEHIIPKAVVALGFNGVIGGTGTYVEYNNKKIYEKYFNKEQLETVFKFIEKHNIFSMTCGQEVTATTKESAEFFLKEYTGDSLSFDSFEKLVKSDNKRYAFLESLLPFAIDDNYDDYFDKYKNVSNIVFDGSPITAYEMNDLFGSEIHVERASYRKPDDYSGEITIEDCNKSKGIDIMLKYLGADVKNSVGIGDGYNDIDMLNYTGISIAMGNAPDDIKKIADYVTDDIFHDGIYNALKHFRII